jgi:hypothetical protein
MSREGFHIEDTVVENFRLVGATSSGGILFSATWYSVSQSTYETFSPQKPVYMEVEKYCNREHM